MFIPIDTIKLILLHAEISVITNARITNKTLRNMLIKEDFWQEKLAIRNIPPIILFDKDYVIEYLALPVESILWLKLYKIMIQAYYDANGIMIINNIYKQDINEIIIDFASVKRCYIKQLLNIDAIDKKYLVSCIKITVGENNTHKLKYIMTDNTSEYPHKTLTSEKIINEQDTLKILSSFIFRIGAGDEDIEISCAQKNGYMSILRNNCCSLTKGMWMMYDYYRQL